MAIAVAKIAVNKTFVFFGICWRFYRYIFLVNVD